MPDLKVDEVATLMYPAKGDDKAGVVLGEALEGTVPIANDNAFANTLKMLGNYFI